MAMKLTLNGSNTMTYLWLTLCIQALSKRVGILYAFCEDLCVIRWLDRRGARQLAAVRARGKGKRGDGASGHQQMTYPKPLSP